MTERVRPQPTDRSGFAKADLSSFAVQKIAYGFFLRSTETQPLFLLLRNAERGDWGFPKGHAESGEAPLATARRECSEECGIGLLAHTTASYGLRYRVGKKIKATFYFPALTSCKNLTLSPEHDQAVWFTAQDALRHLSHESLQKLFAEHLKDLAA